jgi:hypothetical protein
MTYHQWDRKDAGRSRRRTGTIALIAVSTSLCTALMISLRCASKKSSGDDTATSANATLRYSTCANGQTSGSVFTQITSGVLHDHTGTACLHCHDPGFQLDINEDRKASTTAPAYSLAGTLYATAQAAGSMPNATDPAVAVGETILFRDFTNTTQIATATSDCSGNFWVKAADDTRNMTLYYAGGSGATGTATISTTTGGVSALNITTAGTCQGTPKITISGGGCAAAATGTAVMNSSGGIGFAAVGSTGRGCTSTPTVAVTPANCTAPSGVNVTTSAGQVTGVTFTANSSTCTSSGMIPDLAITGLTCTVNPVLQPMMTGTTLSQIVVLQPGSGCTGTATLTLSAGCSVTPVLTATMTLGEVTGVTITSGGSGYTSGRDFVKILGGGTNASGAFVSNPFPAVTGGVVATGAIAMSSGGTGYTSAPTVVVVPTQNSNTKSAAYYTTTIQSTNTTMNLRTEQGDCNSGNCHVNPSASTATGIRSLYNPDPTNQGANSSGTYNPTTNCTSAGPVTSSCYPLTPTAPYATLGNYTGVTPVIPVIPYRYLGKLFK